MKFVALSASLLALSSSVRAEEQGASVDPRYAYTVEAGVTAGSVSVIESGRPISSATGVVDSSFAQLIVGGFATFGMPVAENRKVTVGLRAARGWGDSSHAWFETVTAGYRINSEFKAFQTRLDLQLALDLSRIILPGSSALPTKVAAGPRLAAGGLYSLGRGWRVGAEVSAAVVAPRLRVQFELNPLVSWSW